MVKRCSKCELQKEGDDFYNRSDKPHLKSSHCKECIGKKTKEYNNANGNAKLKRDREYHFKNREKRIAYSKVYNKKTRKAQTEYFNKRYNTDVNFRIAVNLRNRIRMALKRNTKSATTIGLIGCSVESMKKYLQNKFKPGMNWENYGRWQIDHIKPCSLFNLSETSEQKICFHYTNLQPLWEIENRIKSNNITEKEVYHS